LDRWARRPTTGPVLAQRARLILGCAAGKTNTRVARDLRLTSKPSANGGRASWPGAPRTVTDADVEAVLTRTLETKPADATHWSTRSMAQACGLSRSTVNRIWRAVALQPHRTEPFKLSKDPLLFHRWLARHPRVHLHFTPTSSSWLNLVERWFALLTDQQIKRGAHRSTRTLETAVHAYIALSNSAPKPFVWTKTADEILASVARFCQRISGTGH